MEDEVAWGYATYDEACLPAHSFCYYKRFVTVNNEVKYRCTLCGKVTWCGKETEPDEIDKLIKEAVTAKHEGREPIFKKRKLHF